MAITSAGDTWPATIPTISPSHPTAALLRTQLGPGGRRPEEADAGARSRSSSTGVSRVRSLWAGLSSTRRTTRRGCRSRPRDECAAVLLAKTNQTVAIDLSDPRVPRLIGRIKPPDADVPYVSYSPDSDWIMMPVASPSEGDRHRVAPQPADRRSGRSNRPALRHVQYLVCTRHRIPCSSCFKPATPSLGRLPLTGPLNLGRTRPTGLAYSPDRGLLAVATRSGSIHLIEMVPRTLSVVSGQGPIAASGGRRDVNRRVTMHFVRASQLHWCWPTLSAAVMLNLVRYASPEASDTTRSLAANSTTLGCPAMFPKQDAIAESRSSFCPEFAQSRRSRSRVLLSRSAAIGSYRRGIVRSASLTAVAGVYVVLKHDSFSKPVPQNRSNRSSRSGGLVGDRKVSPIVFQPRSPVAGLRQREFSTFLEGERMGSPAMYRVATGGVKLQVPAHRIAERRIILSQDWSLPADERADFEDLL